MTGIDLEKIIDELANRIKQGRDISRWQNNHAFSPIANLLVKLHSLPKASLPHTDLLKIKNQVLDRIAVPESMETTTKTRAGFLANLIRILPVTSGIVATFLIVVSLTVGTAVAALQSVPGDSIYPLKKIVENLQLRLATNETQKANLQIQFANNRLEELSAVIAENNAGEIPSDQAQKIVTQTVNDLQASTAAALSATSKSNNSQPKVSALTKIVDLSNKQQAVLQPLLRAASIQDDGEVTTVLKAAIETSQTSKDQALKNIENAGMTVDDQTTITADPSSTPKPNAANANGKITALSADSVSIGTSKFLLTKDTKYVNIKSTDLKVDVQVTISGEVRDDQKTYALTISPAPASNPNSTSTGDQTNTPAPQTPDTQNNTNTQAPAASPVRQP